MYVISLRVSVPGLHRCAWSLCIPDHSTGQTYGAGSCKLGTERGRCDCVRTI